MRDDLLHVVTAVFNPCRWQSRIRLARDFIGQMRQAGLPLTVVETAYGNQPFELADIPDIRHVPTRAATPLWCREAAINVGIRSLPPDTRYVAWIDADITFERRDWAAETIAALQTYAVVQPWSEALDLGPDGEPMEVWGAHVRTSFGRVWCENGRLPNWRKQMEAGEPYTVPHSGYAWAATMGFLNAVGLLLDTEIVGGADIRMALGVVGRKDLSLRPFKNPSHRAHIAAWCDRAFRYGEARLGYVPGRIAHTWHGDKSKRLHRERFGILNNFQFDPATDIYCNRWGITELAGNKPEMQRAIEAYFRHRDEDATTRAAGTDENIDPFLRASLERQA